MTFTITKIAPNNFIHFDGFKEMNFSNWEINFNNTTNTIILQLRNGAPFPKVEVLASDVIIKNGIDGTPETFSITEEIRARLVQLDYNPLKVNGSSTNFSTELFGYTSGAQEFTTLETISQVLLVFRNGKQIDEYTYNTEKVTVTTPLTEDDEIYITYSPNLVGVSPFYTKAEVEALISNFTNGIFFGAITPSSTQTGTNDGFWIATQNGTYTDFDSVVVNPNSFAIIGRASGVISISQTALDLTEYVNYNHFVSGKNLFDKDKITNGFYLDAGSGNPVSDAGFIISDFIRVLPSTNYYINSDFGILFYKEDKTYITFAVTKPFTTPSDCNFVRFALTNATKDSLQLELGSSETIYEPFQYTLPKLFVNSNLDRWRGKNVNFLGDSITAGLFVGTSLAYPSQVSKILNLKKINNYGVSSSLISKFVGKTDSFVERYPSLSNDVELNVIFGGINDYRTGVEIGTISSVDEFEFYGALKSLISGVLTNNPDARLCFIIPYVDNETIYSINYVNSVGYVLKDYVTAIKNVCEIYSVPVYDSYSKSGINAITESSYTSDGLHPTASGHIYLAKQFSSFFNTL